MQFPHMLIMRNAPDGVIWQAYEVQDEQEERILTKNAIKNGFIVYRERQGYTSETAPGWRNSSEWKRCLKKDEMVFS